MLCNWEESSLMQIAEMEQQLQNDPLFSGDYDVIMDITRLTRQYTSQEIENLAIRAPWPRTLQVKFAVVADTDASFGVSRIYQILTDQNPMVDMKVFRNSAAAMKWLNLEDLDIESLFREIRKE